MTPVLVDAHVHLWDADAFELPWWRPDLGLARRRDADDLAAAQAGVGTVGSVVVQAAHTPRERDWLTSQLRAVEMSALVAQHDPAADPAGLAHDPPFAGVRLSLRAAAADWRSVRGVGAVLRRAEQIGGVVELLCRPDQLVCAASVAETHPRATFVLDHLGLGADEPDARWAHGIAALARRSNAMAKLSGLFVPGEGSERVQRAAGLAWEHFTPSRVMFGSDWPMSARVLDYADVLERTDRLMVGLTAAERDAVWGANALRTYWHVNR